MQIYSKAFRIHITVKGYIYHYLEKEKCVVIKITVLPNNVLL